MAKNKMYAFRIEEESRGKLVDPTIHPITGERFIRGTCAPKKYKKKAALFTMLFIMFLGFSQDDGQIKVYNSTTGEMEWADFILNDSIDHTFAFYSAPKHRELDEITIYTVDGPITVQGLIDSSKRDLAQQMLLDANLELTESIRIYLDSLTYYHTRVNNEYLKKFYEKRR